MTLLKRRNSYTENSSRKKKWIKGSTIFIIILLAYPVLQFLIMWIGVNFNTILLTFQANVRNKLTFVGWDDLFYNYKALFESFKLDSTKSMFGASLVYLVISCFITLPIALFFSYFIFKKIYAAGFFKVIFYLPSIIPLVILTLVFKLSFDPNGGLMSTFLGWFGVRTNDFFVGDNAKWMVWIFCIWAGIGYDVILLTAGMSRIPKEILESIKMDGVSPLKEFFHIIIPLTWPTISTLFLLGMMSVFNVVFQPFFLTSGQNDTMTIGLKIYQDSQGTGKNSPATLGLFCSIIATPIILGARSLMNRLFKDVNY